MEAAEPISQQEPEEAVQQIEEKVLAAFSEQSVEEEAAPAEAEEASPAAEDDYPEGDPFAADPVDEPTRRINLNDLKFGRNYSGGLNDQSGSQEPLFSFPVPALNVF